LDWEIAVPEIVNDRRITGEGKAELRVNTQFPKNIRRVAAGLTLLLVLSACTTNANFLYPASPVSAGQANLFWIILWMSVGVFVLVWALLIINIVRFRRRKNDSGEEPRQKYGSLRLEIIWTAIPILLVLTLFILSILTIRASAAPQPGSQDVNITVIGHQWWWEFDYPDLGIQTANEMHVPAGRNIKLKIQSADVIHSFWVPQLANKIDAIPGMVNNLWFRSDQTGVYEGHCAEFCGANHAQMGMKVFVEPQKDFDTWVSGQQAPPPQPSSELQQRGYTLITQGICSTCHNFGDHKAANPIAPNLTHVMSRTMIAGEYFPNNAQYMQAWLTNNQAMKPGNAMSGIHLSQEDIQALLSYLMTLK
jgi:cytochrome c oxidase subunit 2